MMLRSLALIFAALLLVAPASAADKKPLLMEGKKTLYQRVLAQPDAKLFSKPGAADGKPVPAMSIYYVYARQDVGGAPWLEVGPAADGKTLGWIPATSALDWKQQIVLTFTNPSNRDPALMFDSAENLEKVLNADDPGAAAAELRKTIAGGNLPADFPVIATEPNTYIDFTKQFYLLPILDSREQMTQTGAQTIELQLASLPAVAVDAQQPAAPSEAEMLQNFTAGVVFVIDSTKSMGPYIDRTREAVEKLYEDISGKAVSSKVAFGLVAFRAGGNEAGIDYTSKVFVDPNKATDKAAFMNAVKDLSAATVSTPRFDEDSLAGVMSALKEIDWSRFGARYIVLITDAGPLGGNDPISSTKMNADQVRLYAKDQGAAIYTLHLLTPAGAKDHAGAKSQYEILSTYPGVTKPLYYPIAEGSVDKLGTAVELLADAVVKQIEEASSGKTTIGADPAAQAKSDIEADTAAVGHAMRLAYLGRAAKTTAPKLVQSWMIDRDFAKPSIATVDVRVLLTKAQLSDLQQTLKGVLDAAHEKQFDPAGFYDAVKSVAAALGRDPAKLQDPKATSLSQMGLLGEYVEGLPYKSAVLNIDADTWKSWPIAQQNYFLDELERKLALYKAYNEDVSRWVTLTPGAPASEQVYPVPLDALP
ncbi:vWA domain-containing protein [Dongia sp. agr-C8]